jgi:hypothetical protein
MGLRLRGVIRCGRCRKPRGIRHTCVARSGARRGKTRMQSPVTRECGTCHKPRGLRHTCTIGTDFKVRKRRAKRKAATAKRAERRKETRRRQAERRKQAAADRRARDKARKRAAKGKPRTGHMRQPRVPGVPLPHLLAGHGRLPGPARRRLTCTYST